jgi:hypothetical protein
LDILAKNRKIERDRLGSSANECQDDENTESYDTCLVSLINNERQKSESDWSYLNRLQTELEELSQSREIALSVMALHRRLLEMMTEFLQVMKNQKTPEAPLGDFFLNFANDMLVPYVRYSVNFFEKTTSQDFIRPSNPDDLQKAVDFVKNFVKVKDSERPIIHREEWEDFLKFPLQRLHIYSEFLDMAIAKSNRPTTDIENRKLKIAKLKILAAFNTIRERFE